MASICDGFAPVPVLRADLAAAELVGPEALDEFGAELYDGVDPAAVLHEDLPLRVDGEGDGYVLRIALPFADKDDMELGRHGTELLVRIGPHRRSIVLPDALSRRQVVGAAMVEGHLNVRFGAP
jgi:arsenite-transporting ATPase